MANRTKEVTVNGTEYRIGQVGGETADLILFKVGQAVSSAVTQDADLLMLIRSVRYLSAADFRETVRALANVTQVGIKDVDGDGRVNFVKLSSVYDDHFRGNSVEMVGWLKEALDHNFGNFFEGLKTLLGDAAGRRKA